MNAPAAVAANQASLPLRSMWVRPTSAYSHKSDEFLPASRPVSR